MCGRYSLEARPEEIAEAFALAEAMALAPRYNIAPTQDGAVVRVDDATGERRLGLARWGFPSHPDNPRPLFNARSETVDSRPSFRAAFRSRRCLVPATGFYEWQKLGGAKQPFNIRRPDHRIFAFAGIWGRFPGEAGQEVEAYTILTTRPNDVLSALHDRMPVILDPGAYALWLDAGADPGDLKPLLAPFPDEGLTAYPVSTVVNNAANDDPACTRPLADERTAGEGLLFS